MSKSPVVPGLRIKAIMNTLRIFVASIVVAASANATGAGGDSDLQQCLGAADTAQCLWAIHAVEDKRLNDVYKKSLKAAIEKSAGLGATLKKSQQAWIKFRDEWCKFESDWEGGTLAKNALAYCNAEITRRRADELDFYSKSGSATSRFTK